MVELSKEAVQELQNIINRGNNAEVKKKENGVIILEVTKKIKYRA